MFIVTLLYAALRLHQVQPFSLRPASQLVSPSPDAVDAALLKLPPAHRASEIILLFMTEVVTQTFFMEPMLAGENCDFAC